MSHIYCPECGFQSPEAATYCSRCGALLIRESVGETTLSLGPADLDFVPTGGSIDGPALTVSRRHAELVREANTFTIRDLGSLNGTFVNKRRIESSVLEDDDEVQVGKYRMTFLRR